jgi:hypothetical protein
VHLVRIRVLGSASCVRCAVGDATTNMLNAAVNVRLGFCVNRSSSRRMLSFSLDGDLDQNGATFVRELLSDRITASLQ